MTAPERHWNGSLLLLVNIIHLLATTAGMHVKEDKIPHFDLSKQGSYVLENNRPWLPGRTTTVTFGRADEPMQIHLGSISGGEDSLYSKSKSCHLMFKCSSEDSEFQQIDLVSSSISQHSYDTDRFCEGKDRRKFKLQKLNSSFHALTLLKAANISFEKSLKHLMEFRVRAEFVENDMSSSSLFIYSVDSLFNINNLETTSGGYSFSRYFLTDDAIQFLTGRTRLTGEPLMRVNFLEKKFVDLLLNAPVLIRNYLAITVIISCTNCSSSRSAIFTTKNIGTVQFLDSHYNRTLRFNQMGADIGLQSGAMHVGTKVFSALNSLVGSRVRVTLGVSLDKIASFLIYNVTETVMEFSHVNTYATINSGAGQCFIEDSGTVEPLTLFVGTYTAGTLDCPIVCSGDHSGCQIYTDGKLCDSGSDQGFPREYFLRCEFNKFVLVTHSTFNFGVALQPKRLFEVTFAMSSMRYTYRISLVEMPLFFTVERNGTFYSPNPGLPPVTYAKLNTRASFNCTVSHSFLDTDRVEMSAHIQLLNTSVSQIKWVELSPEEFAVKILKQSPASVDQRKLHVNLSHSLLVELPHVTNDWSDLQMAFLCRVKVANNDAKKLLGVPQYETETRTHVVVIGSGRKQINRTCRGVSAMPWVMLALLFLSSTILAPRDCL